MNQYDMRGFLSFYDRANTLRGQTRELLYQVRQVTAEAERVLRSYQNENIRTDGLDNAHYYQESAVGGLKHLEDLLRGIESQAGKVCGQITNVGWDLERGGFYNVEDETCV